MTKRIKVLQVTDTLGMGGAETWLMELVRRWSRTGEVETHILATSGDKGLFDDEAEFLGASIHYIAYRRAHLWAFARQFRLLLQRESFDAIHDHQAYASGWHFLIGAGLLPPVRITHVHNPFYQVRHEYGVTVGRRMTAQVGKALVRHFATHIAGTSRCLIGEYGFDDPAFQRIPRAAIHCGFDTERFSGDSVAAHSAVVAEFGWPENALLALFAGRIDEDPDPEHPRAHKNAGFAVDVAIAAAHREPRLCMLLAGQPSPATPLLERRIAHAGLSGRIRFLGVRRDIESLMLASDVLLVPSRSEGLGMVIVEAQAAGLHVLASTTVPRECEVVPGMVRFRNLKDGPESWVEDLLVLAAEPRRMSANGIVASSSFSLAHSSRVLVALYTNGKLLHED